MDEQNESFVYDLLKQELGQTIMISVGHRSTLIAKHDRVLTYAGAGAYQIAPSSSLSAPA